MKIEITSGCLFEDAKQKTKSACFHGHRCRSICIAKNIIYVVALVQNLASLIDKETKQHPRDTNKEKVDASPVHMKRSLPNLGVLLAYRGTSGTN